LKGEPRDSRTAEVDGFELCVPNRFAPAYLERPYEPLSTAFLSRHLGPGKVALDVGAHVGVMTLRMARLVGESGLVVAAEPSLENRAYIERNLLKNGLLNVRVEGCAVGARDGSATLNLTSSSDSHGLFAHPNVETIRTVTVPLRTVDSLVEDRLDLFKVDTEGGELDVLDGMAATFRRNPQVVGLVELAPACLAAAGRAPRELIERLRAEGLALTVLDDTTGRAIAVEELGPELEDPRWFANIACIPHLS
jgi:FkbM family methyltransferase